MAYISVLEMRKVLIERYSKEWVAKKSDAQIIAIFNHSNSASRMPSVRK